MNHKLRFIPFIIPKTLNTHVTLEIPRNEPTMDEKAHTDQPRKDTLVIVAGSLFAVFALAGVALYALHRS